MSKRIQRLELAAAEGSVLHDRQPAGAAEVSVRNLKCQVREQAAFVRLTGEVSCDGKTAYSKIRGTEHSLRLPFFGERVRYKGRPREGGVAGESICWRDGIFVGIHRRTNQYRWLLLSTFMTLHVVHTMGHSESWPSRRRRFQEKARTPGSSRGFTSGRMTSMPLAR